jgi:homoserine kinase
MAGEALRVRFRVPATTANLGPGFDCLGMALQLYNEVDLSGDGDWPLSVHVSGNAATEDIPRDDRNLVCRAADRVFQLAGTRPACLTLSVLINAPLARGLGSSASAIVGGMTAANALLGYPVDADTLLNEMIAMEGHPDNVVACMHGGLTASLMFDSKVVYQKHVPAPNVKCVLLIPDYQLATAKARQALPRSIPVRDAIFNLSRIPFVIGSLTSGNLSNLDAIMDDRIHQPYRKILIREYEIVESEAVKAGAAAVCLSGAGPAMLAICDATRTESVAEAMRGVLDAIGTGCRTLVVSPDHTGICKIS